MDIEIEVNHNKYTQDPEYLKLANQAAIIETLVRDAVKTVLEGFEKEVFIRNTKNDHKAMWTVEVFRYMQALALLQKYADSGKV